MRVALLRPDPMVAARLAGLPGVTVSAGPDAAVVIADGMPPGGAPVGPAVSIGTAPVLVLPVLVLAEGAAALAALRAGARAVLPRDAPAADLGSALAAVARGLVVLPADLLAMLVGREEPAMAAGPGGEAPGLTRREREVLDLLAAGASNKVIARRLGLSFHTAKAHVAAVLQKLGAGSRADAVARGARAGLVLL